MVLAMEEFLQFLFQFVIDILPLLILLPMLLEHTFLIFLILLGMFVELFLIYRLMLGFYLLKLPLPLLLQWL